MRQHIDRSAGGSAGIGSLSITALTVDIVAEWSAANERVLARTTAKLALLTLSQVLRFAVRRGWLAVNSVTLLEPAEKPRWKPGRVSVLDGRDLAAVLDQSGSYRRLYTLMAYTGLRIGEALGLTWVDVDFDDNLLTIHQQLTRWREHGPLKTEHARREVVLAPAIVRLLREQWIDSPARVRMTMHSSTGLAAHSTIARSATGSEKPVRRSGVRADGRLSLHSLRHGYASLLMAREWRNPGGGTAAGVRAYGAKSAAG